MRSARGLLDGAARLPYRVPGLALQLLGCASRLCSRPAGGDSSLTLRAALGLLCFALDSLCSVGHRSSSSSSKVGLRLDYPAGGWSKPALRRQAHQPPAPGIASRVQEAVV